MAIAFQSGAFEQTAFETRRDLVLVAGGASVTSTGKAAIVRAARALVAAKGAYSQTGSDADIHERNSKLPVNVGAYAADGYTVRFTRNIPIISAVGAYQTAGVTARLFTSSFFTGDPETVFVAEELRTIIVPASVARSEDEDVIYVPEELRTMIVPPLVYRSATGNIEMLVEAEAQTMYIPPNDFPPSSAFDVSGQVEPRKRAAA